MSATACWDFTDPRATPCLAPCHAQTRPHPSLRVQIPTMSRAPSALPSTSMMLSTSFPSWVCHPKRKRQRNAEQDEGGGLSAGPPDKHEMQKLAGFSEIGGRKHSRNGRDIHTQVRLVGWSFPFLISPLIPNQEFVTSCCVGLPICGRVRSLQGLRSSVVCYPAVVAAPGPTLDHHASQPWA